MWWRAPPWYPVCVLRLWSSFHCKKLFRPTTNLYFVGSALQDWNFWKTYSSKHTQVYYICQWTFCVCVYESYVRAVWKPGYYWLLLRSGMLQSVPCTEASFWSLMCPLLSSNHSWFIRQNALLAAETPSSESGIWRKMSLNLADVISLSYSTGIFSMP
jgi:hypothetical protein